MARRGTRRCLSAPPREVAPGRGALLVDNEAGAGAGRRALPDARPSLPLGDNRGFAGGANAGLERAFARRRRRTPCCSTTTCSSSPAASRRSSPRPASGRGLAAHRRPAGRRVRRRRARARGAASAATSTARATTSAAPASASHAAAWETRRAVQRGALPLLRGRRLVPARPRARRAARPSSLEAHASHSGGSSSGGEQGETWAYYSTRNRLWLLEQQRGTRKRAARPRARACARGCGRCSRRAAPSRAPSLRVCTTGRSAAWGGARGRPDRRLRRRLPDADARGHARGSRAGCATRCRRAARRRADRARRREWQERGSLGQKRDALQQDLAWYGLRLGTRGARRGAQVLHCPTFRGTAARGRAADGGHRARPRRAARAFVVPGLEPQLRAHA